MNQTKSRYFSDEQLDYHRVTSNFLRTTFYYKRYQPSVVNQQSQFPLERTLSVINFNQTLPIDQIKKTFQLMGKIKSVHPEQVEVQIKGKVSKLNKTVIVFKHEYSLTKCFNTGFFQQKLNEANEEKEIFQFQKSRKDQYVEDIINQFEEQDSEQNKFVEDMEQDGFQVVFDDNQQVDLEKIHQSIAPQSRKARKRKSKKDYTQKLEIQEKEQEKENKQSLRKLFEEDKLKLVQQSQIFL